MSNCLITTDASIKPLATQLDTENDLVKATRQDGQPRAHIWRSSNTLVVTKPEARLPGFKHAQQVLAESNWPVVVRNTGGAAVPQSPDTLNLSLIYPAQNQTYSIDNSYELLCQPIIAALLPLGITAKIMAVEGSFCDGKYNLAVEQDGQIKKIVGTSQKWTADKIVLAHAVILTSIDTDAATKLVNTFYNLAGSQEKKQADTVTSIQAYLAQSQYTAESLREALTQNLAKACESLDFLP